MIDIKEQEYLMSEDGLIHYHKKIVKILKTYMDMKEEYYNIVAVWIIGTYLHKQFSSYPYLYVNAMKGSGKTRLLKIIATLSNNGQLLGSMTEAVLFRTATNRTLCIDEMENINSKGNENLSLLLNSAYKKGMDVERMTKKKTTEGESQVVERFKVYCPITIANIRGMESVLGDRCISMILEKSTDTKRTKLIENFDKEMEFKTTKGGLMRITEKLRTDFTKEAEGITGQPQPDMGIFDDVITQWNTAHSDVSDVSDISDDRYVKLFKLIDDTEIAGRDLELFFPLFIISDMMSQEILIDTIKLSLEVVREKRSQDREDNMEVRIYGYVSQMEEGSFMGMTSLLTDLRSYLEIPDKTDEWLNVRYLGRALRRLNLVTEEMRTHNSRMVRLDIQKAKDKYKLFQREDNDTNDTHDTIHTNDTNVINNNNEKEN